MKNVLFKIFTCLLLMTANTKAAQADGNTVDRQTPLNTITDFFATLGKSPQEVSQIKKDRRADRKQQRLKNQLRRNQAQTRQRMQQQAEDIVRKEQAPYKK